MNLVTVLPGSLQGVGGDWALCSLHGSLQMGGGGEGGQETGCAVTQRWFCMRTGPLLHLLLYLSTLSPLSLSVPQHPKEED